MTAAKLANDLRASVAAGHNPFETYKDFGGRYGFNTDFCPSWANRSALDTAAAALKSDPRVGLDLTFLIRNGTTGYPSVIDGKPYDRNDNSQKVRARAVADQIISKFGLKFVSPY